MIDILTALGVFDVELLILGIVDVLLYFFEIKLKTIQYLSQPYKWCKSTTSNRSRGYTNEY